MPAGYTHCYYELAINIMGDLTIQYEDFTVTAVNDHPQQGGFKVEAGKQIHISGSGGEEYILVILT